LGHLPRPNVGRKVGIPFAPDVPKLFQVRVGVIFGMFFAEVGVPSLPQQGRILIGSLGRLWQKKNRFCHLIGFPDQFRR
jgi:hypothetical protein